MSNGHETIADIVAEKRALADRMEHEMAVAKERKEPIAHRTAQAIIDGTRRDADRLEAALRRDLSKICPKSGGDFGQLGEVAKLREALEEIDRIVWDKSRHTKEEVEAHRLATETLTALAAPATAENSSVVGNAAKLREALLIVKNCLTGA